MSYSSEFFDSLRDGSRRSAEIIVPLILNLFRPSSVIDIGCGTGSWLSIFKKHGLDILGVDGDYIDSNSLEVPQEYFVRADLSKPLKIDRTFDVVMSLEVAEHLEAEYADQFVDNLIAHGSFIVFSAAIPFQGGTHHVNEQWPDYWAAKFAARGFTCIDYLRPKIWNCPDVESWYAQNLFFYIQEEKLFTSKFLSLKLFKCKTPLRLIHPHAYVSKMEYLQRLEDSFKNQKSMAELKQYILNNIHTSQLLSVCTKRLAHKFIALTTQFPVSQ